MEQNQTETKKMYKITTWGTINFPIKEVFIRKETQKTYRVVEEKNCVCENVIKKDDMQSYWVEYVLGDLQQARARRLELLKSKRESFHKKIMEYQELITTVSKLIDEAENEIQSN